MKTAVVWLRRDFRLRDQPALHHATRNHSHVLVTFVLDPAKLGEFSPGTKPFGYFFGSLLKLREELQKKGGDLLLLEGDPTELIPALCRDVGAGTLYFNKDYEPASIVRDVSVTHACEHAQIRVHAFRDHVLHEESEILSGAGTPYRVFTPYRNACMRSLKRSPPQPLARASTDSIKVLTSNRRSEALWKKVTDMATTGLRDAGISRDELGESRALKRLRKFIQTALPDYSIGRNLPALNSTSHLSADLRCGAISPRVIWHEIQAASSAAAAERDLFLSEILWRDFFIMIGFHSPHVFDASFNHRWDRIRWRNDADDFKAWCEGRTGYPIVDAGMRELLRTGFMHNRVRMITAMFLVKDLLIDWRWGERFFREHLIDGDHAVNNGNWQWCASTGADAQPYFRVFNPTVQSKRYDSAGDYIRRHVPELRSLPAPRVHDPHARGLDPKLNYPMPRVAHSVARMRVLLAYRRAIP